VRHPVGKICPKSPHFCPERFLICSLFASSDMQADDLKPTVHCSTRVWRNEMLSESVDTPDIGSLSVCDFIQPHIVS